MLHATGAARRAVRAAQQIGERSGHDMPLEVRAWAREQAQDWCAYFGSKAQAQREGVER